MHCIIAIYPLYMKETSTLLAGFVVPCVASLGKRSGCRRDDLSPKAATWR